MSKSSLSLLRVSLPREELSGQAHLSARNFFDFFVDGVSLRSTVAREDISVISDDWDARGWAIQLLPGADRDQRLQGRAQIYGCRECSDIECGGVAVKIEQSGDSVRWAGFVRFRPDFIGETFIFEHIEAEPLEFDLSQYRSALELFLERRKPGIVALNVKPGDDGEGSRK
jgi:hypothetical protein